MRVAVCISGQMRHFRACHDAIRRYIIEPNDADVFLHTWYDPSGAAPDLQGVDVSRAATRNSPGDDQALLGLYQPKRHLIEPPRHFRSTGIQVPDAYILRTQACLHGREGTDPRDHAIHNSYSMFYSIFTANRLKEEYALEHGIHYDMVIRIRYDLVPTEPLRAADYDPDMIYYAELHQKDSLVSDWINMGSNAVMNAYAATFLLLPYLNSFRFLPKADRPPNGLYPSDTCTWGNEHMIRDAMVLCRIPKAPLRGRFELRT